MEQLPEHCITGDRARRMISLAGVIMQVMEAERTLTPEEILIRNYCADRLHELDYQAEAYSLDVPVPVTDLYMTLDDDIAALREVPLVTVAINAQLYALQAVRVCMQLAYISTETAP